MCGIGGIFIRNNHNFSPGKLMKLWQNLEDRGQDASGIAFLWKDSDEPIVMKNATTATEMSEVVKPTMGKLVQYALLHTRFTTQGSTENNNNNHPVVKGSVILTHNGVIRNDSQMFFSMREIPEYEVDTEALATGISVNGISWTARKAEGSMSIAWVDKNDIEKVNLFTNGRNPLVIAELPCGSYIWASGYHHLRHYYPKRLFHAKPGIVYTLSQNGISSRAIKGDWPHAMTYSSRRVY